MFCCTQPGSCSVANFLGGSWERGQGLPVSCRNLYLVFYRCSGRSKILWHFEGHWTPGGHGSGRRIHMFTSYPWLVRERSIISLSFSPSLPFFPPPSLPFLPLILSPPLQSEELSTSGHFTRKEFLRVLSITSSSAILRCQVNVCT